MGEGICTTYIQQKTCIHNVQRTTHQANENPIL